MANEDPLVKRIREIDAAAKLEKQRDAERARLDKEQADGMASAVDRAWIRLKTIAEDRARVVQAAGVDVILTIEEDYVVVACGTARSVFRTKPEGIFVSYAARVRKPAGKNPVWEEESPGEKLPVQLRMDDPSLEAMLKTFVDLAIERAREVEQRGR